ncbi:efflux RND transporter permease subunit [Parvularcula oceani]|uniref:efflux RND transporter permease subunit n=1 Tax=Parvularcula oceani TaxID=1247963 RepID=UPI0004E23EBB|nr:efflux RND transporter permease subunit [Parvularcula oceani]
MAQFFIHRPVFAWVIAIVTMLAGVLALRTLAVEQYPEIAPPSVTLAANYPGASAQAVEDAVTQVIEQQMTGLDGLRYISASSGADGTMSMTLTFESGTDPDIAQVQVQNRLARATPLLPEAVQRQGVTVSKARAGFLLILALTSDAEGVTSGDLADAMASDIEDAIARVEGVGTTQLFGAQHAMRIWLDPYKLAGYGLSPQDVVTAIRSQNVQVTGGQIGAGPSMSGQQINASVTVQSLMETPEEFRAIPLRTAESGAQVTVGDVARVEIGSENYNSVVRLNGKPVAGMGVNLATGANALRTAELVRERAAELSEFLPAEYDLVFPVDTTPFIEESIHEVVKTLFEAAFFVFLIMFLFLQKVRATLIVMITVPVVLLGTFAVLLALGFTINTLTMLAMVLGIGLLVDDAIVVIENVDRLMEEKGLSPRRATEEAMAEITSALVGIGVVLSAVFVPMAFFGGTAGVIYRQFAVTIVTVMALSVLFALVLTPALCATLLRPAAKERGLAPGSWAWRAALPLRLFNRAFGATARGHERGVRAVIARSGRFALLFVALAGVTAFALARLENAFLPDEDQGQIFVQVTLPAGATFERTHAVLTRVSEHLRTEEAEAVEAVFTVAGFNFSGNGQNAGLAFVRLKDWEEREEDHLSAQAVAGRAMAAFSQIQEAQVFAITPPSVPGLGQSSGFDLYLQDRGGRGHEALTGAQMQLIGAANSDPQLVAVRPNGLQDVPQLDVDIDYNQALASGLDPDAINTTLATALGGVYVNDFLEEGRIKRVYVAADAPYRGSPEDILVWRVPGPNGSLVPFSSFAQVGWTYGSPLLQRYNGVPSVGITGSAAPGVSSGVALDRIEELADALPPGFDVAWTGLSAEEREVSGQAPLLYALSLLVVFLSLAALYESWSVPVSVMLIVPLGVLGAVAAVYLAGLSNDIFLQVGLLAVIGLSAKNAILIVEFAKAIEEDEGRTPAEAAIEAARLRLRPILMTSFAFGLGVVPLALSSGAGAGGRSAIGISVLGGTIAASALGVFFTPLFYVLVRKVFGRKRSGQAPASDAPTLAPAGV